MPTARLGAVEGIDAPPAIITAYPDSDDQLRAVAALEYVQVDAISRHMRSLGGDVLTVSGSDENSLKNVLAAEQWGMTTRELVDGNVVHLEDLLRKLDVRVDRWIRTSVDQDHLDARSKSGTAWRRRATSTRAPTRGCTASAASSSTRRPS